VDYFFLLKVSTVTIRLANDIANISAWKTVTWHHPLSEESVPTTLENPYSIAVFIIPLINLSNKRSVICYVDYNIDQQDPQFGQVPEIPQKTEILFLQ
jgi:hypothetical protein